MTVFTVVLTAGHYDYSVYLMCSLHLLITMSQSTLFRQSLLSPLSSQATGHLRSVLEGRECAQEKKTPDVTVSDYGGSTRLVIRS